MSKLIFKKISLSFNVVFQVLNSSVFSFGRLWVLGCIRCFLIISSVSVVSACQADSKMLASPVTGYNHASSNINSFSVNGAGGGNLGPHEGGGSQVCCGSIPRYWTPGIRAIVEWEKDPNPREKIKRDKYGQLEAGDYQRHAAGYTRHKVTVDVPKYDEPGSLNVHFLPCDQVRVSATGITPGYPGYPYNYPLHMEEPKVCLTL
ncbi:hypothetical protein PCAU_5994 [Pseudomonas chlororaphis subsp. aurantiaca]|uniref:DUF3304 domain-containing protein n=1 Tax=Pseudomonas chlororaphis TaxID=587753 RepID=UPI0008668193|nr:DUF3304 domain-containing protein [Pseudomonas chlororaphis]BAV78203.1 hypothetical protein PCAU_5994 [Pseudomonas chlororaphis subsp. aurantiaca]